MATTAFVSIGTNFGRHAVRSRNQLVLDMSRRDVQDYLIEKVNAILDDADIYYVKWDINRSLSDIYGRPLCRWDIQRRFHSGA